MSGWLDLITLDRIAWLGLAWLGQESTLRLGQEHDPPSGWGKNPPPAGAGTPTPPPAGAGAPPLRLGQEHTPKPVGQGPSGPDWLAIALGCGLGRRLLLARRGRIYV